jgi:PAS domain S-box-containing protein
MIQRLASMSTRALLAVLVVIMAVPAAAVIVTSGLGARREALAEARADTRRFVDGLAAEQQNLFAAGQQLLVALAHLPQAKRQDPAISETLAEILRLNEQYTNIFIADLRGDVWASGFATGSFNVADRRYFQSTVASGQLSFGEFVVSRANRKSSFNLAHPLRDDGGAMVGVIAIGFDLTYTRRLLGPAQLRPGANYHLLDHRGVILARGLEHEAYFGKALDPPTFAAIRDGSDLGVIDGPAGPGPPEIVAYRKLRLVPGQEPAIYVQASVPLDQVLGEANRALRRNVLAFAAILAVAFGLALVLGKISIVDRLALLERAATRLAEGDREGPVSALVKGGELGRLAGIFDGMAEKVSARERALRESESNYREILDATSDAIFLHDAGSGDILLVNRSAERLYGYPHGEIPSLRVGELSAGTEGYTADDARRWMERAVTHGPQSFPWLARRKDGEQFWAEVVLTASTIGGANRVLAVVRDVSERRRAEEERQKLQAQLLQSQKMEAVGRLAGGVAHDFNNLLTVINGTSELLLGDPGLAPALRDDVQTIRQAGQSAATLTQQLLAFSRKQVLQPVALDLNVLVGRIERMLRRVIGEDVDLVTHLGTELWSVRADPGQMEQVILNLAVNSRDAMPGGGKLTIETGNVVLDEDYASRHAEVRPGNHVLLAVSDSGVGMDPETLSKVFEPFFSTKGQLGTGLGLSTVYGIVRQSGGHVLAYSEPGHGTTFKVYFPAQAGGESADPVRPAVTLAQSRGRTVLVVEDSEGVRNLVVRVLSRRGHEVLQARDAAEALALAARSAGPIHLLVSDVVMPGMTGRQLADRFLEVRPGTAVLFMSGYTENAIVHQGVLDPGVDFLAKPFTLDALVRKVEEILRRGQGSSP